MLVFRSIINGYCTLNSDGISFYEKREVYFKAEVDIVYFTEDG